MSFIDQKKDKSVKQLTRFKIINGKFDHNDDYKYDFHYYFGERVITLYLLLPGINEDSVRIQISSNDIKITASIQKQFEKLYKHQEISISGNVPIKIHQNTMYCRYIDGILIVELAKDLT